MASEFTEFLNRMELLDDQPSTEFLNRMELWDDQPSTVRRRKIYKNRYNPMTVLSEEDFKKKYRFSKENMMKLIGIVDGDLNGDPRGGHIPVNLQVMASIRYWGRNEIQDDCADIHGFSQATLSIISARVAKAFASKARQFLKMPRTTSEQISTMQKFKNIRGFPNVIGAIDCTHIRIKKQGGDTGQYYVNRKGYYSINVQAVCDANLKILDIVCHWRGSTHDSRIYGESSIKDRFDRGEFRGRLLGDGGYACTNHLFTPVQNPSNSAEENYNIAHIATRNTIERTFGVWKSRFRILLTGMRGSLKNVKTLVVALAVLHNMAIEYDEELDDENDSLGNFAAPIPHENQQSLRGQENSRSAFIATHFS